jgi:V-type H+-transporting ATPase subunit E
MINVLFNSAQSNQVNKARLRALQARDELLENIREEAKVGLSKVSSSAQYPSFLEDLILQSFCRLIDGKNFTPITIQVRQADVEVAKKALGKALEDYKKLTNGVQLDKVTIDEQRWLDANCAGGIVANTLNGRIRFNNTIEARLELATEALLPALRTNLFGASECRKFFD